MNLNPVVKSVLCSILVLAFVSCNRTATLQVTKSTVHKEAETSISEMKVPAGFEIQEENQTAVNFTAANSELINDAELKSGNDFKLFSENIIVKEEDTTKVEPKFEPLVLTGTATAVGGLALGLLGLFGSGVLLLVGAALLIVSAVITMIGWKKIKADPKKFKGEKLAILNYIIIGLCGVAASFYLLYLLFTF